MAEGIAREVFRGAGAGAAGGVAVAAAAAGGGRPPTGPAGLPPTALCPEVGTGAGPDPTLDPAPGPNLIRNLKISKGSLKNKRKYVLENYFVQKSEFCYIARKKWNLYIRLI